MLRRQAVTLALTLSLLAPIACGGDGDGDTPAARPEPGRLSAAEEEGVNDARLAIRSYCRRIRLYIEGRAGPPAEAHTRRAYEAVDRLVSVARENPEAQHRGGGSIRQLVGDTAEDLEGSNCSSDLVARLDRGLASLSPP